MGRRQGGLLGSRQPLSQPCLLLAQALCPGSLPFLSLSAPCPSDPSSGSTPHPKSSLSSLTSNLPTFRCHSNLVPLLCSPFHGCHVTCASEMMEGGGTPVWLTIVSPVSAEHLTHEAPTTNMCLVNEGRKKCEGERSSCGCASAWCSPEHGCTAPGTF